MLLVSVILQNLQKNDCITYYPRFVKSTKRHSLKEKQNVEGGWEPDSTEHLELRKKCWIPQFSWILQNSGKPTALIMSAMKNLT